jgi:hypothetical protein
MKLISYILLLSSLTAHANLDNQEPFDKAYKDYWSKPVEDWSKIVGAKKSEVYVVRKKDTLSELSEVFFGTPNYWPKIWSLNNYIGNPHLIYPGNQVGFELGTVQGNAPKVFVGGEQKVAASSSIFALDDPEIKIPPEPNEVPVLDPLPGSFPEWQNAKITNKDGVLTDNMVESQLAKLLNNVTKFNLTSFLHQGELRTYGEIKGFLNVDFDVAGSFDEVYIKPHESLPIGTVFTIVMPRKNAKTPKGRTLHDVKIFEYVGEVQIIDGNKNNSGLVAGRVTRAIDIIDKGALLISGKVPQYDLTYNPEDILPVDAQILRGSEIFGHNILGIGQTVFLSQGEKQGVTPGAIVEIKQNRYQRNPEQELLNIVNKIGVIKVVLSSPDVSTGIVVSSRDFMAPGDKTTE